MPCSTSRVACERAGAEESVLWSNLLRVVGDDGADSKALPSSARWSKRGLRVTVNGTACDHGWVSGRRRRRALDGGSSSCPRTGRGPRDCSGRVDVAGYNFAAGATRGVRVATTTRVLALSVRVRDGRLAHHRWVGSRLDGRTPRSASRTRSARCRSSRSPSQALVGFSVEYESRVPFAILVGVHFDAAFAGGSVRPLAADGRS